MLALVLGVWIGWRWSVASATYAVWTAERRAPSVRLAVHLPLMLLARSEPLWHNEAVPAAPLVGARAVAAGAI
ncbi:MAG: hypothetical protein ACRDMZ_21835, partial [Solirubrobacteraceae bacterium]